MTDTHIKINAVVPKVQYTGNGSTTVFPYEFPIFDDSDMVVYFEDEVQESGYTVSGAGQTEGGNVTFDTAPEDGVKITLIRNVPIERLTDFQEGGTFRPKNLNDEFDRQTAFVQQVQETLDRAVKVGPTSDVDPETVLTEVERVYASIDNVDAVADDIANVNAVAGDLTNIDAVAGNATNINAVNANKANIDTVAGISTNVTSVAGNATNINAVASNETNINAVNANKTNIDAVAGNSTNINSVATNSSNINAVASNASNINAVAGNETNINAVNSNKTNIDTVATNISDINTCATNMSAITSAPTYATNAANSATAAADSATLSAQYANDKINQTHISNYLTAIPQDVFVELSGTSLVVKAGTKFYRPDGTVSQMAHDNTLTGSSLDDQFFVCVNYNGGAARFAKSLTFSGPTAPTGFTGNGLWFDTTNNKIKNSGDGGATWSNDFSLPIALMTSSGGAIVSIDQVFNGFGFIDKYIYALPGVAGLVPNGRNADGTLKSTAFTNTAIALADASSLSGTNYQIRCANNHIGFFQLNVKYDADENYVKDNDGNVQNRMIAGAVSMSSSVISSISIRPVFRCADYNQVRTQFLLDYSAGATLNSGDAAPADGLFILGASAAGASIYVDGLTVNGYSVPFSTKQSGNEGSAYLSIPLSKGDVVSYTSHGTGSIGFEAKFFPYKGN